MDFLQLVDILCGLSLAFRDPVWFVSTVPWFCLVCLQCFVILCSFYPVSHSSVWFAACISCFVFRVVGFQCFVILCGLFPVFRDSVWFVFSVS